MTRNGTGNAKSRTRLGVVAGRRERVELLLDDAGDPGAQPLEPAHRELGGQQLAQPGVVGRVGEAEPADVAGGRVAAPSDVRPDVVAERRRVRRAPGGPRGRR